MKNFLSIIFFLIPFFHLSQESLEPLRTNYQLLEDSFKKRMSSINNNDFIYLTDTLNLPVIDDFSTNKFKYYNRDTSLSTVSDSSWYQLYFLDGTILNPLTSYMSSPTYRIEYDSITLNGLDTILMLSYEQDPDTFLINNLSFYPITQDTIVLWPNITIVDSLWTSSSPDISYADLSPDFEQDSITLYFAAPLPEDFNKVWLDNHVFLNNNFSLNPWTFGVATFDGLNSSGMPYDWTVGSTDWADELTSKPIFMSQNTISDSIYLSFFFQSGGNGETPEGDDSLSLEFYIPSIDSWVYAWSTNGFVSDDWYYQHILLDSMIFFQDGFKFRFRSYGSLTGSLDHWNLDYVYLNENRSQNDTLMHDWAFTNVPISIINNYSSVPWKHFNLTNEDLVKNNLIIPSYNSSNNPKLLQPCSMDLFYKNNLLSNHPYSASVLNIPPLSYFDMLYDYGNNLNFNIAVNDTFPEFDFRFYLATNTTPERLSDNDTVYHTQSFQNYYSYDDGSAEAAYGLVGNGAELAYRFIILEGVGTDTLKSVKIHFSPSVYDASNDPFFIQVWADSMGNPGNLIYSSDNLDFPELYYPEYNSGLNGFYEYELPLLIPVSDTFYIGWKQSSSTRLNIGFDKNVNRKSEIFYNLGSGFQNTIFDGSLMMRPVFVSPMDNVVNATVLNYNFEDFELFPNPANQIVNLSSNKINDMIVYDLNGRIVFEKHFNLDKSFQVNNWKNGIYILHFKMINNETQIKKLIIQHH